MVVLPASAARRYVPPFHFEHSKLSSPQETKRIAGCAYELNLLVFITLASPSKTSALLATRLLFHSAYYIYISKNQVLTQENLRNIPTLALCHYTAFVIYGRTQNDTILFALSIFTKHSFSYCRYGSLSTLSVTLG